MEIVFFENKSVPLGKTELDIHYENLKTWGALKAVHYDFARDYMISQSNNITETNVPSLQVEYISNFMMPIQSSTENSGLIKIQMQSKKRIQLSDGSFVPPNTMIYISGFISKPRLEEHSDMTIPVYYRGIDIEFLGATGYISCLRTYTNQINSILPATISGQTLLEPKGIAKLLGTIAAGLDHYASTQSIFRTPTLNLIPKPHYVYIADDADDLIKKVSRTFNVNISNLSRSNILHTFNSRQMLYHYNRCLVNPAHVKSLEVPRSTPELTLYANLADSARAILKRNVSLSRYKLTYTQLSKEQRKAVDLEIANLKMVSKIPPAVSVFLSDLGSNVVPSNLSKLKQLLKFPLDVQKLYRYTDYLKLKGHPVLCPHFVAQAILLYSKKTPAATINLIQDNFAFLVDSQYLCKICGMVLGEHAEYVSEYAPYYLDPKSIFIQSEVSKLIPNVKFPFMIDTKRLINSITDQIKPEIMFIESNLIKLKSGDVNDHLIIYIASYAVAVLCKYMMDNPGTTFKTLPTPTARRKIGGASAASAASATSTPDKLRLQFLLKTAIRIVFNSRNSIINRMGMNVHNIQSIIVKAYKWANGLEKQTLDKAEPEEHNNITDFVMYSYITSIFKMANQYAEDDKPQFYLGADYTETGFGVINLPAKFTPTTALQKYKFASFEYVREMCTKKLFLSGITPQHSVLIREYEKLFKLEEARSRLSPIEKFLNPPPHPGAINLWDLYCSTGVLHNPKNAVCALCGKKMPFLKTNGLTEKIESRYLINSFYEYFQFKCPGGGYHNSTPCTKCGINRGIFEHKDEKYYNKFKNKIPVRSIDVTKPAEIRPTPVKRNKIHFDNKKLFALCTRLSVKPDILIYLGLISKQKEKLSKLQEAEILERNQYLTKYCMYIIQQTFVIKNGGHEAFSKIAREIKLDPHFDDFNSNYAECLKTETDSGVSNFLINFIVSALTNIISHQPVAKSEKIAKHLLAEIILAEKRNAPLERKEKLSKTSNENGPDNENDNENEKFIGEGGPHDDGMQTGSEAEDNANASNDDIEPGKSDGEQDEFSRGDLDIEDEEPDT